MGKCSSTVPYRAYTVSDRTMSAARTMLALLDKVRDVRLC